MTRPLPRVVWFAVASITAAAVLALSAGVSPGRVGAAVVQVIIVPAAVVLVMAAVRDWQARR